MNVIVRLAKIEEARVISEINMNTWKGSYRGYIPNDVLDTRNITENMLQNRLDDISNKNIFVAEVDKKIIGYTSIKRHTKMEVEIGSFYILPEYQRLGIGGILLKEVLINLKNNGYKKVIVWTMKNFEKSNNFYKKYGGILTGNTKKWNYNIDVIEFIFTL
ncbi:MAG: GNAT family N-acetyltransferase [Rickettsiales bacterium]|nr:GNAT family N-acetyltransferase [Rickettsiales bacterium]